MRAVFISYRREDAEGEAGRMFADLAAQFGEDRVFMDVVGIAPGRDFRKVIDEKVATCGVLLAVIGKSWLDARDEAGNRRLDNPMDFVRLETASALKRDIAVIPVLVHGARTPKEEQLPADLKELVYRNAVELSHARWSSDLQLLVVALRKELDLAADAPVPATSGPATLSGIRLPPQPPPQVPAQVPPAAQPAVAPSLPAAVPAARKGRGIASFLVGALVMLVAIVVASLQYTKHKNEESAALQLQLEHQKLLAEQAAKDAARQRQQLEEQRVADIEEARRKQEAIDAQARDAAVREAQRKDAEQQAQRKQVTESKRPPPPASVTPAPGAAPGPGSVASIAPAQPGAVAYTGISGNWVGRYVCAQRLTGLNIELLQVQKPSGRVNALARFFPLADSPTVQPGAFTLYGRYDARVRELTLFPERWVQQPPGYAMAGMVGRFDDALRHFTGTVRLAGCTSVNFARP